MAPGRALPSLEEVRTETAWLRRLAGALTRDDALAEDAVQETWVARLAHPPHDTASVTGWLAIVLRNVVRKRARGDVRRRAREEGQAVVYEGEPDPEHLALRLEAHRQVAELALALDEPYRATVLLRYYEDLSPSEIARRQGIPAGTVRWRLKTGLDRVRADLDRRYAAPRWRRLLLPLVPGERGLPWKAIMATKATTKGALVGLMILLAVLAGWRVGERRAVEMERVRAPAATAPAKAASARGRAFGTYRPGARTSVPRLVAAVPVDGDAGPPRFVTPPRRLERGSGEGPRNRLEHPPPNLKEIQAEIRGKLDEMHERADRCLAGWTAADPALEQGLMLGIDIEAAGLQSVWIRDLVEIPTGPLRCLSDAVYALDWGGIVEQPISITVPQRYAAPDGGAP